MVEKYNPNSSTLGYHPESVSEKPNNHLFFKPHITMPTKLNKLKSVKKK